jgi:acetyl esterase/lipase
MMTCSFKTVAVSGMLTRRIAAWTRTVSPHRIGSLLLLLAALLTLATYLLQATLNYPAIMLDRPSLARALAAHGGIAAALGFFGLLLCGLLVIVLALSLEPSLETSVRGRVTLAGVASGACWAVGALLGLALVPLWASANTNVTPALAAIVLALAEIAAPLLLALWTVALARQLRAHRALGWVGAFGLLLVVWRSLLWGFNALLPIASGFYGTADILSALAVVGVSLWLLWLLRLGCRLVARNAGGGTRAPQVAEPAEAAKGTDTMHRRRVLRGALGLGVGLAGAAFVGVRTGFTIAASPELEGDDIPAEPSLIAAGYYLLALILFKIIHPVNTVAALASQVPSTDITPPPPDLALAHIGALIEPVEANGVPAERIRAPRASSSRWILYFHGGGWAVPGTNDNRAFVGRLSKGANMTALYPNYRLIPEHPFPDALQDCVATYRWLRQQGVPASHIGIAGESAGGNLTLATALALKENGDELPAALVAISPPTDMAMTGETYRTKALVDASPGGSLAQDAFALYTNHGATNPRNPLVSPLYGDVHGFPPTLIQVGTQEVFLSDATRMAEKLKAAGVAVKLEVWPGMFHAFTAGPPAIPEARLATQHVTKFLRRHLGA